VLSAGPIDLAVNFPYPVEVIGSIHLTEIRSLTPPKPREMLGRSLKFSHVTLSVTSTGEDAHDVKLYAEIIAEWVLIHSTFAVSTNEEQ